MIGKESLSNIDGLYVSENRKLTDTIKKMQKGGIRERALEIQIRINRLTRYFPQNKFKYKEFLEATNTLLEDRSEENLNKYRELADQVANSPSLGMRLLGLLMMSLAALIIVAGILILVGSLGILGLTAPIGAWLVITGCILFAISMSIFLGRQRRDLSQNMYSLAKTIELNNYIRKISEQRFSVPQVDSQTNNHDLDYDHIFAIKLVGPEKSGKTSLILRFVNDSYEECVSTMGVDFQINDVAVSDKKIRLRIYDTAFSHQSTLSSQAFLIVFDLFEPQKEDVEGWIKEIKDRIVEKNQLLILVGTKSDCFKETPDWVEYLKRCYGITYYFETKKREVQGLIDALEIYKHAIGIILTADELGEEEIEINDKKYTIKILPIWKWLLE